MLGHYFRLAWVDIRHSPGLVVMVIVTLAVGLVASMATLTLRYALTADPVPDRGARLLNLQNPDANGGIGVWFNYAQAEALGRLGGSYGDAVIMAGATIPMVDAPSTQMKLSGGLGVRYTTRQFFRIFDAPLAAGRVWSRSEQASGAPVAVLRVGLADVLFPNGKAVGKQVRIGDTLYTVTGVIAPWNPQPRFYDLNNPAGAFGGGGDVIFLPLTTLRYAPRDVMISMVCGGTGGAPPALPDPRKLETSSCRWLSVWYLAHTRQDVPGLARSIRAQVPQLLSETRATKLQLLNVPDILARADLVPAPLRTYVLLGLAFLVLCVINASGMQLSRAMRSASSVGIRRALGARRSDIVQQYLCESLLIGGVGGVVGIALTYAVLDFVRHIPARYMVLAHMAHVDGSMLALMIAVALACSVLAGLVPAVVASRANPALAIKSVE